MSCLPQEDPVLESTADMLETPLDPEVGHRAAAVVSVTQQVCFPGGGSGGGVRQVL